MWEKMKARREACAREMMKSEIGRHLLGAKKEMLLATRAVIDAKVKWLESLDQTPAEPCPPEEPN
jgi:hypothetical protein